MAPEPVLISGQWRAAKAAGTFQTDNPATGEKLPGKFPVSSWMDCDEAIEAAMAAANQLGQAPPEQLPGFLTRYAERIEARKIALVEAAHSETALPGSPRLADVELPRTTDQLRQAAAAVQDGSWALPTIDSKKNIRSLHGPLGPVLVIGPNNFPFAYNGVAGGDFVAAIAAGNPVIAKAHPCHPLTTKLLAEEAFAAVTEAGLPPATVQLLYDFAPEDGLRLVSDKRLGGVGFTGSRATGLKIKAAADAVGKPAFLEMSSINPVVILPGALAERAEEIAAEFTGSCLAACGQMCTSPGLAILTGGEAAEKFIAAAKVWLEANEPLTLLSSGVAHNLAGGIKALLAAGAELVTGGSPMAINRFANTLLRVSGETFLLSPEKMQLEAFGNASLVVVARDVSQLVEILNCLEGNLTGSIYSDTRGADEALYAQVATWLRPKVGRLLNDKMPTGVAVTAAMNHGGPFPATGHPGFTAVGMPASLRRFAMLQCYDNVRLERLPRALQNQNPNGRMWRLIDGHWSQADVEI